MNSNNDYDAYSDSTMPIMHQDNDNIGAKSDLSSISSVSNKSLFAKKVHSNCNACDLSDNSSEICIKNSFSTHTSNKIYDTILTEHGTKENYRRVIPIVIGWVTHIVKTIHA